MRVRDDVAREAWDAFVGTRSEAQFVQSWAWGEFQQAVGNAVHRFAVEDNEKLIGACQAVVKAHGIGIRSLNVFRAPIIDETLPPDAFGETLHLLWSALVDVAGKLGATYAHVDPGFLKRSPASMLLEKEKRFVSVPSIQPEYTLLLPLPANLESFHEKTRYNIRLAERKGVTVRQSTEEKDVATFIALTRATAKRDGITAHADRYYRTMVKTMGDADMGTLFVAEHDGTPLAANFVVAYGDTATYLHGASGNEHRNLMAPHLLQWRQMEWAATQGKRWYDFWGIHPDANHQWAGITRFKQGFGGEERHYATAVELPLKALQYQFVRLRRRLR